MSDELLGHAFGVIGQTLFLFVSLWIMIKLQKLQYHLLGLIGSALLACLLDCIPYVGIYVSVSVLLFCITKVIGSRTITDAIFTVGIAYAITFCFNLFVLASLIGSLTARFHTEVRARTDDGEATITIGTNGKGSHAIKWTIPVLGPPAKTHASNQVMAAVSAPAPDKVTDVTPAPAAAASPAPVAVSPAPVNTTNPAPPVALLPAAPAAPGVASAPPPIAGLSTAAGQAAVDVQKRFVIKGISLGANETIILIGNGTKTWDFAPGESHSVDTAVGKAVMKCESADESKAVFTVEGVRVTLVH